MQEEYAAALKSVGWGFIDPPPARSRIQAAGADAAAAEAGPGLGKSPPAQQDSGGRASDLDSEGRQPARGRKRCVRQAKEAQSSSPPPAQLVDAASAAAKVIAAANDSSDSILQSDMHDASSHMNDASSLASHDPNDLMNLDSYCKYDLSLEQQWPCVEM